MTRPFHSGFVSSRDWLKSSAFSRLGIFPVLLCAIFVSATAGAQFSTPELTRSSSGQFVVSAAPQFSPLFRRSDLATNTALVRLEPALLAVSAEHFKALLWRQLGLEPGAPWRGKFFLALHPARTPDDGVTITTVPFVKSWDFRVDLPDVVLRARFDRALAAALLLEIATRNTTAASHDIEIPSWLADGLAQQAVAGDDDNVILSAPDKMVGGIPETRFNHADPSLDPFAAAHRVLQNFPAPTFDQLSWPADAQLNGNDGGAYLAGAQVFVHSLLGLKNGAARLRAMLAQLPGCYNWQTAFFSAFRDDFKSPLDVEKWWALRIVEFAGRDPGPRWTFADSRDRFDGLLSVPVEFRSSSNSLPVPAEISLQDAIKNFNPAERAAVLEIKLRDLEFAQFRLAPPFAGLAGGYRSALADFLGERGQPPPPAPSKHRAVSMRRTASAADTLQKLDALAARRRAAADGLNRVLSPLNLNRTGP